MSFFAWDRVVISVFGLRVRFNGSCERSYIKFKRCCSLLYLSFNKLASLCRLSLLVSKPLFRAHRSPLFCNTCNLFRLLREAADRNTSPYSNSGRSILLYMIMYGLTQYSQTRCSNTHGKSLVAAPQNLKREIRKESQFDELMYST